jgi:hypothetical protein
MTLKQRAEQQGFEFKTRTTSDGDILYYGQRGSFKNLGYLSLENAVNAAHKYLPNK